MNYPVPDFGVDIDIKASVSHMDQLEKEMLAGNDDGLDKSQKALIKPKEEKKAESKTEKKAEAKEEKKAEAKTEKKAEAKEEKKEAKEGKAEKDDKEESAEIQL